MVVAGFVLIAVMSRHPEVAERLGRRVGRRPVTQRIVGRRHAQQLGESARLLADRARSALSRRHFLPIMLPAVGELLLDAGALYLFFLAVGYMATPGSVLVAYAVANVLAALPITPAGLGVIEASLTAIMVAYGAPARVAVPAVLGYRIVNYWLPLPVGAGAYVRLRTTPRKAAHPGPAGPDGTG